MAEQVPATDAGTPAPHHNRRNRKPLPSKQGANPSCQEAEPSAESAQQAVSTAGMARFLTDPAIEAEIQAFIATAPPMAEVKRARLARLLRTKHCHHQEQA